MNETEEKVSGRGESAQLMPEMGGGQRRENIPESLGNSFLL